MATQAILKQRVPSVDKKAYHIFAASRVRLLQVYHEKLNFCDHSSLKVMRYIDTNQTIKETYLTHTFEL